MDRWNLARVVPVPKGRGGSEVCDYGPVAVLSTPAQSILVRYNPVSVLLRKYSIVRCAARVSARAQHRD